MASRESMLEEATRSMSLREMCSVLESQGENHPWVDALLQRLEQAEARSRSTASYHSVVEPTVAGHLREGSERHPGGMAKITIFKEAPEVGLMSNMPPHRSTSLSISLSG